MNLTSEPWGSIEPSDLLDPIGLLTDEHDRQLALGEALTRLADEPQGEGAAKTAEAILGYLEQRLPLHVAAEIEDFYPLLQGRAEYSDEFEQFLVAMREEHDADGTIAQELAEPLRAIASGKPPPDAGQFQTLVRRFTALQRRHLLWENQTILGLARKRLEPEDLARIGWKLAARYDVPHPEAARAQAADSQASSPAANRAASAPDGKRKSAGETAFGRLTSRVFGRKKK